MALVYEAEHALHEDLRAEDIDPDKFEYLLLKFGTEADACRAVEAAPFSINSGPTARLISIGPAAASIFDRLKHEGFSFEGSGSNLTGSDPCPPETGDADPSP